MKQNKITQAEEAITGMSINLPASINPVTHSPTTRWAEAKKEEEEEEEEVVKGEEEEADESKEKASIDKPRS